MRKKSKIGQARLNMPQMIVNNTFLLVVFLLMILPMWNVVVVSTSSTLSAQAAGLKIWWTEFSFEGYEYVFKITKLMRPFFNSVYISVTSTFAQVFLSSLAGYILIQRDLPFKGAITSFILLTMMVPGDLTLISIYQLNKQIGLIDTYTGLIVNGLVSGFCIMLMRNYFLSVPDSLAESARIDGSSEFRIYTGIYLPISLPGVATVSFLEFVSKWNSIMLPATITTDQNKFTLPLIVRNMILNTGSIAGTQVAPDNAMMAAIVISTIPLVLIYVFAQRFLLSGMTLGATKE